MPFVDAEEQALLDGFFGDGSYPATPARWIGLSTTTPTDAGGNVTEPSTGAYARVQLTTAIMAAASGTAPASKSNGSAVSFAQATADWSAGANMTYWVVFDASTAGTARSFGQLSVAKPVLNGDTASFAAAAIVHRLGKGTAG